MSIKQVLEARGIYSVELELELLRALAGGQQTEYYQPAYTPPTTPVYPTTPTWPFPYEITCTGPDFPVTT